MVSVFLGSYHRRSTLSLLWLEKHNAEHLPHLGQLSRRMEQFRSIANSNVLFAINVLIISFATYLVQTRRR